jgi:hypothetical protein
MGGTGLSSRPSYPSHSALRRIYQLEEALCWDNAWSGEEIEKHRESLIVPRHASCITRNILICLEIGIVITSLRT